MEKLIKKKTFASNEMKPGDILLS